MRFFTFILVLFSLQSFGQICNTPGMNPQTGISVCGTTTFPQSNVPSCTGAGGDLMVNACFDDVTTDNSVWYRFHCYTAGTLGFTIGPASGADDYDWAVLDITGHAINDIYTQDLTISVNLSATTGQTGCTPAGTTDYNCAGNTPKFNRMRTLVAGHDYLLMVTNWSNSGAGFNLNFNGTAQLTDQIPPSVLSVATVGCNRAKLLVTFSEDILCSSLSSVAGTEFSITNGTHIITGITSVCSSGNNAFTQLTIDLQSPLPPGNYNLVVNAGADNNTLLDVCLDPMVVGTQVPFTVTLQQPAPVVSAVSYNGCAPTVLKVALNKQVTCASITATGSEFTIMPGNIPAIAVQTQCIPGPARTDTILVQLQNPLPFGNYQLLVGDGTDLNTLVDTCGTAMAATSFPFVINQSTVAPVIQSIVFDECKPNRLVVNFDKPVACNTIATDGSDFTITGTAWPISSISTNCTAGYTTQVILNSNSLLTAGNFAVSISQGNDNNTLADTCFAFIPVGYNLPFTATQAPSPIFDSVQYIQCNPTQVRVFYNHPISCNSVAAAGSQFYITGPSVVNIISATGNPATCSSGYSQWFTLQFSQPINTLGNYVLHNQATPGAIRDTCMAAQNINNTIAFNVLVKPSAAFTAVVRFGCVEDTIQLSHPGGSGINSWTWNFSDGTSASGQNVSHNFPVTTVTASVQLIVSNGSCTDTLVQNFPLNNAFNTSFTKTADSLCVTNAFTFTSTSTGNNLQYLWQFGDNTQFSGQAPPPHTYATADSFRVNLIVTNNHGCSDTAFTDVFTTAEPIISFTGLLPKYCTGETVTLTSNLQGNIASYSWSNGIGIINNQPSISYQYSNESNYTVKLSATDRFCGDIETAQSTDVFKVPVINLGNDTILCPGLVIPIGVTATNGYIYTWSTGASTANIVTNPVTATYLLQVDNNGCLGEDEITVTVLENCLVRVPGAFTPNNDGLNDVLRATNAYLAKNFLLRVYNRMGQLIFETKNPLEGWNGYYKGQPAEQGTYVWQLSYFDQGSNKAVFDKGTSILIR